MVEPLGLGTAAVTVFDKSTDIIAAIARLSEFTSTSRAASTAVPRGDEVDAQDLDRLVTGEAE